MAPIGCTLGCPQKHAFFYLFERGGFSHEFDLLEHASEGYKLIRLISY